VAESIDVSNTAWILTTRWPKEDADAQTAKGLLYPAK